MIVYLERTEKVLIGVTPDFARIFYDPLTEDEDKASLVALIPNGKTFKHYCDHQEGGSCKAEEIL